MNMTEERPWRYIKDCKSNKRQREREDLSDKDAENDKIGNKAKAEVKRRQMKVDKQKQKWRIH